MERNKIEIDAANQSVGRLASQIVKILQGKNKASYIPYIDSGDFVIINNIDKIKFTGKKLEQKKYYRHSGYPGGKKEVQIKDLFINNPGEIVKKAVAKMLPNNKLKENRLRRLIIK